MQTLNNAELTFLAVVGHPELTTKVLKVYSSGTFLFSKTFNPHLNVMWNAYTQLLAKYKKQYGLSLSKDITAAGLAEAVVASNEIPDEIKTRCETLINKLTSGDIPDKAQGAVLVKSLMELDVNRKLVSKLNSNPDLLKLQQSLDAAKRTMSIVEDEQQQKESVGVRCNPLRDIKKLARREVRVPTGLNFLDKISSGGGRAGDLWLILGSPGSGKSLMSVQYSCAQAMLGNSTLWATYEQSMEGDIAERMIANVTDTSLDRIRDVGFENLPQEIQDHFWSAVAGVDDRLVALDMTKAVLDKEDPDDYGGVKSIWKQYNQLKAEGNAPKTIILDWFGSMMSKIAANLKLDLAACYRFKAQEEINNLIALAKQEKIMIIVFHQLSAKAAGARPTYLPNATEAQDMHNLQNFFDLVAVIGKRDVHDICYFSSQKSRKGTPITCTLKMIGEKSRFMLEEGWLPNRDGNFYKPGEVSAGTGINNNAASEYIRELD